MAITGIFDFATGMHEGTLPVPGRGLTAATPGATCRWTGPVYDTVAPFDWAVASWNGDGGALDVEVRAAFGQGWSP
ncbi:MAG TPA: hypothetical protein VD902_06595, partial [Symbiobacteriaceae bacterium]|nr:hypothetical protein [Symbiobacteriaceae bacterium]